MSVQKVTVSNKVAQEIVKWDSKEFSSSRNIYIEAGVGVGKSFFVKNDLYNYAKEHNQQILFLIHRTKCVEQFTHELKRDGKLDHIEVKTYQKVGSNLSIDNWENILLIDKSYFHWIVCDEAHYFCSDSEFNSGTTADLNFILNYSKAIKIFMSATGEIFLDYCKSQKFRLKKYELPISYKYIKSLQFYYESDDLDMIQLKIDECIAMNKKCVFFIQKISKMVEYYEKYKVVSAFSCSTSNQEYSSLLNGEINQQRLKSITENEILDLDTKFLFTTTAMDAGVNINNSDLHEVFVDIYDIDTIKQCIGRKRLQSVNDYINLTVRAFGNKSIAQKKVRYEKGVEIASNFTSYGAIAYKKIHKNNQDEMKMVIDDHEAFGGKSVNQLKYIKYKVEIKRIRKMQEYAKNGYIKFIASELKFKNWSIIKSNKDGEILEEQENDLEKYLDGLVGKKLDKDAQQELIEKVDHRVNGKLKTSPSSLNFAINSPVMENLPYVIIPKQSNGVRHWLIEKFDKTKNIESIAIA